MEYLAQSWLSYGLLCLIIPLIYWYFTRNFNYWSKRGIKGPKPIPVFGNLLDQFITIRSYYDLAMMKKYGKIYGLYNGNVPTLFVADPELIKDILVKDFHVFTDRPDIRRLHPIIGLNLFNNYGESWKRIRTIVSPVFTSSKMKKMYPMIKDCLNEFIDQLNNMAEEMGQFNCKEMFGRYALDVIATCAYSTKTNSNNQIIETLAKMFNPKYYRVIATQLIPRFLLKLFNMTSVEDESDNQFLFQLIRQIINKRKIGDKSCDDFINLLLTAEKNAIKELGVRDDNDLNESHHVNEGKDELEVEKRTFSGLSKLFITDEEILAQSYIFFQAGYETTSTALSYASYELALNQDIQQRLYEEVLGSIDSKGDIDYYLLSKLNFLDAVISETLRLHTSVGRLIRKASENYKLGTTGHILTKGQVVEIPSFALHHSEEYYEEPFKFNPDRFMPENRHKIIPYTYLPFGAGPRNCIGMRFALMEAKVCLAQIIRRFRLFRTDQTDVPLVLSQKRTVLSAKRIIVGIEKRM